MSVEFPQTYQLPQGAEIIVRRAQPGDVAAAVPFMRAAYEDAYVGSHVLRHDEPYTIQPADIHALYNPENPDTVDEWRAAFARPTSVNGQQNVLRLIAHPTDDPTVMLAFASCKYRRDGVPVPCPVDVTEHTLDAELYEIDVARSVRRTATARGQGVGTVMLHATTAFLSAEYDSQAEVGLATADENLAAQTWFVHSGFWYTGHADTTEWPNGIILPRVEMATKLGVVRANLERRHPWLPRFTN